MRQFKFTAEDRLYTISDIPTDIELTDYSEVVVLLADLIEQDTHTFAEPRDFSYANLVEFFEL